MPRRRRTDENEQVQEPRQRKARKRTDKEILIDLAYNLPVGKTKKELAEMSEKEINSLIDAKL